MGAVSPGPLETGEAWVSGVVVLSDELIELLRNEDRDISPDAGDFAAE